jgi:hypothetical protein
VEATTARLERAIKSRYPEVKRLFLEVQSEEAHAEALKAPGQQHEAHEADVVDVDAHAQGAAVRAAQTSTAPAPSRKNRKKSKKKKGAR